MAPCPYCNGWKCAEPPEATGLLPGVGDGRKPPVQSKDWILHFRSTSRVIWDGGVGISPLAMESCVRDEKGSTQPMRFV